MSTSLAALICAFLVSLLTGVFILPLLRRLGIGQEIRKDGPQAHLLKAGTPTMGGIIFLVALLFTVLLFNGPEKKSLLLLFLTFGFALLGFGDDLLKVVLRRPLGLRARTKLSGQLLVGLIFTLLAVEEGRGTQLLFPFLGEIEEGLLYFPFALFVLAAASNAVNLTDGLDGLAAGSTFFAMLAYLFVAQFGGEPALAVFSGAVAGGCLGFLFFNVYPAKVFMGDSGSLALGAALGGLAILTRTEILLALIGGLFVVETLSVILQVISFRLRRKRLFRMSPLHHHFELKGWPETKVVGVFWLTSFFFACAGLLGYIYFYK